MKSPRDFFGKLLDEAGGRGLSKQPLPHKNQETECKFIMSDVIVKEIFRKRGQSLDIYCPKLKTKTFSTNSRFLEIVYITLELQNNNYMI